MRRWVDEAAPDSLRQTLLEAGRSAAPSEAAKQELLRALAAQGVGAAAGASLAGKAGLAAIPVAAIGKGVLLVGLLGAGAFLYAKQEEAPPVTPALVTPVILPSHDAPVQDAPVRDRERAPSKQPETIAPDSEPITPDTEHAPTDPQRAEPVDPQRAAPVRRGWRRARGHEPRAAKPPVVASPAGGSSRRQSSSEPEASGRGRVPASAVAAPVASEPTEPSETASSPLRSTSEPVDTSLGRELVALEAARRALRAADVAAARRLLSDYFASFPSGYLAPEAHALERQLDTQNTPPP